MSLSSFGMGFAMGFGSGFFSREVLPLTREILRPISRVMIRSTVRVFEQSREGIAKFGERVEDIFAEVKHDLKKERIHKKRTRPKAVTTPRIVRAA